VRQAEAAARKAAGRGAKACAGGLSPGGLLPAWPDEECWRRGRWAAAGDRQSAGVTVR